MTEVKILEKKLKDDKIKKKFRINSKQLFLTYSRTSIKPLEVLKQLQNIFNSKDFDYIISQEKHEQAGLIDTHIHVYIRFYKKKIYQIFHN
jgi:hypothetical protein